MKKVNPLKYIKVLTLLLVSTLSMGQDWKETIKQHRDSMDHVFADPERSILKEEDIASFNHIPYYSIDENFRINARFERVKDAPYFEMATTTERTPQYRVYGTVSFELDGVQHTLNVYQNKELMLNPLYKEHLFIPFTDETNYEGSYPGGRYLDLMISDVENGSVLLDFNRCYNPYCAYNDRYSCPIPPSENHLETRIEAGVKYGH